MADQDPWNYNKLDFTNSKNVEFIPQEITLGHEESFNEALISSKPCWPELRPCSDEQWPMHGPLAITEIDNSLAEMDIDPIE